MPGRCLPRPSRTLRRNLRRPRKGPFLPFRYRDLVRKKLVQFIGCGVAGTDCDGSKDELPPCQAADVEGKTQERAKEEILREMCCLPNPELPDVFIVQDLGPCPSRLKGIVCSLYQCCCHLFRETAGLPRVLGGESKDQGTHAGSGEKGENLQGELPLLFPVVFPHL